MNNPFLKSACVFIFATAATASFGQTLEKPLNGTQAPIKAKPLMAKPLKAIRAPALQAQTSQTLVRAQPSDEQISELVQKAIAVSSFDVRGHRFPNITREKSSSGSCCVVGETRTVPGGSFLHDGLHRMKKTWNNTMVTGSIRNSVYEGQPMRF